ncbi:conserved hypothetical protein [Nostocoides japonicum T1-X7]|uniref:Uncharacterized protein n=1 Tax=Nostocoides japonicum T1-X7 TaxID=1194083 RepID=A0A077M1N4_9MICO|nr:nitroreductase family deazaflavin-dependent oxidoreductase [Tetrasphaera japonica]CCH78130.1 conserved hypothetical protein [Tetrasphaera japonica T1-X7]
MSDTEYAPSSRTWVREQVETIEATGTTASVDIMGLPVVLLTMRGAKSGKIRKVPLMRVEHEGRYAVVGSQGGAPTNPQWVSNVRANPHLTLQDGTTVTDRVAREVSGEERATWWERCVAAYPPYAEYQTKTDRLIPIFVLEPA